MTITQTITSIAPAANPATMDRVTFSAAAAANVLGIVSMTTELNTWATQANALVAGMTAIATGSALAIPLTFSTTITDSDPGNGILRLDNATQNAATTIRTDLIGNDGTTWTDVINLFDDSTSAIKGFIMLVDSTDAAKWLVFSVSAVASPSGYKNITVVNVAYSTANPFANGASLALKFTRNGDKGDTGATGAGVTAQAVGFTVTAGTTPKTLTVALDANVSGTNTGDNAANSTSAALSGATFTGPINEARGSIVMHATTMNIWAQPNIIDGDATVVTITAIANAPQTGARRTLYPPAGTVITNGSTFSVEGTANYTSAVGDGFEFEAVTTSTYKVWIKKRAGTAVLSAKVQEFRLTLTSGLPVTTANVSAATSIYMTPYKGENISLYTSGEWRDYATAEITLALGTLTAALPYDVFAFVNGSAVALTAVAWTNATTRATALAYQDGVLCKSGNTAYRYLGTFYTTSTTTTEDSLLKRNLWNYYHRVDRMMVRQDPTGLWTYTTAAWRQANNSAANQLEAVQGVAEDMVAFSVFTPVQNTSAAVVVASGIGFDSTAANSALGGGAAPAASAVVGVSLASYETVPTAGWHKYCWLEYSTATGTTTWFSAASVVLYAAMKGMVKA